MKKIFGVFVMIAAMTSGHAQVISTNGGSIQGTISDASGAAIPGATVVIVNEGTNNTQTFKTDGAGFYSDGPLTPGSYKVTVTANGFQNLAVETVVRTGTATAGTFKLTIGKSSETIQVTAGSIQVNTDQIALSDVITKDQIDTLPVNGRNFLDLAQIEPGVILQSGESFDPTKAGYSAISVGGVSGRTTRILLDGQDITDETVGTTIFNVSQGAIGEFQLNRSTQDVSGEVTSQGAVLVSTNSGTNGLHGQLFYNFQDSRALFATVKGIQPPFQRNQFGGSVGGPIIKDKLFFFGNSERIKQATSSPTSVVSAANGGLFGDIAAAYPVVPFPFTDTYSTVRLDYNGPLKGHYFVRLNYEVNSDASNFGDGYWLYANRDNTPGIVGGADIQTGKFTHSFRYGYEKFHNLISDATSGGGVYNGYPGLAFYYTTQGLYSGPNYLAPQGTFQSDKQARYDGSWLKGAHNIRYGYAVNRIQGGGFAAFFGLTPRVSENQSYLLATCNDDGVSAPCPGDPLRGYHLRGAILGNGQGFFTEKPGFGLVGGGTADWRESAYIADTWKVNPSLAITAGLRWSVDTGRANQDVAAPLCSDVDTTQVDQPCSGSGSTALFSQWNPAYTGKVHQPYGNFGPQLGLNFAPGNHKTSYRVSAGIFYENDVFNNTTNARTGVLKTGAFFNDAPLCNQYGATSFSLQSGSIVTKSPDGTPISTLCNGESILTAAPQIIALQQQYQADTAANPLSTNSSFVGATLQVNGAYAPTYRTPYAEQFSGGVSREIFKGSVLSIDYVHNATLKIAQSYDQNHVGAARFFNSAAAQNAIAAVILYCGGTGTTVASTLVPGGCPNGSGVDATGMPNGTATIDDYATGNGLDPSGAHHGNGLDSGNILFGGQPASKNVGPGTTAAFGAAFPGQNAALGNGNFLAPIGKVGYDALEVVYRSQQSHPMPGIVSSNLQISYALSRVQATSLGSSDSFFSAGSYDNDHPTANMGRDNLDHTNSLSFGGSAKLKYGPRIALTGRVLSAPNETLTLDSNDTTGDIFRSDLNGDGTIGDLAPGTLQGAYGHNITAKNLGGYVNKFNSTVAGTFTPAGQTLIASGLVTAGELRQLGGTVQPIAAPYSSTGFSFPRTTTMDVSFSYPIPLGHYIHRESITLEPAIVFYNALNSANYTAAISSGVLLDTNSAGGAQNSNGNFLTGNNDGTLNAGRTIRGSGTFDQGAPRTAEFQLKLNF